MNEIMEGQTRELWNSTEKKMSKTIKRLQQEEKRGKEYQNKLKTAIRCDS